MQFMAHAEILNVVSCQLCVMTHFKGTKDTSESFATRSLLVCPLEDSALVSFTLTSLFKALTAE